jgi:hypothetical protein
MEAAMTRDLDRLLDGLDPDRTIEEAFRRADEAINSFPMRRARIDNWSEFAHCLAEFVVHVESRILCLTRPVRGSFDFEWGRAAGILINIYGRSGEKAAFEMTRTGNEGGLYSVLKAVAMRIADDLGKNEIAARVNAFWRSHSPEEVLAASREYLARYGHLLPSEMTEASAARIVANFPKVLENHPKLVQELRRVGR